MGYRIPPPDFTLPPMQVNVAAELGKTFAAGIDKIAALRREEKQKAEKLENTQNAFKNGLILQQNELKDSYFKSLEKAGINDDPEKENELFDQFQKEVDTRAKAALDARMRMEFGADLSDEERMQLGKTVSDFKSYSENSLAQMGGMLADADLVLNKDYVVVGDPMNGEQISNTLALQNINGANPRSFDPDAKTSRTLTTKGNQNVVTSTVKIPVSSDYFKRVNKNGGGDGANIILQNGLDSGIIKTENIDGKDYYVFKSDINVSNYSTKGGMDLVQEKIAKLKSDETLQELGYLQSDGAFNKSYISEKPVITQEIEKDLKGNSTGYNKQVSYKIIDVGSMVENKAYTDMLAVEYGSVFKDTSRSQAQRQQYLIDIGIPTNIKTFDKLTEAEKQFKVMEAIERNMWTGYFPAKYKSTGRLPQQVQIELSDDDQGKALLKQLQDIGYKNPATGELYKQGDYAYVIREEQSRSIAEDPEGKIDSYEAFSQKPDDIILSDLESIPLSISGRPGVFYARDGKIYHDVGGDDRTNDKEISMKMFRDTLGVASSSLRNK
jgi:hypothetical protein